MNHCSKYGQRKRTCVIRQKLAMEKSFVYIFLLIGFILGGRFSPTVTDSKFDHLPQYIEWDNRHEWNDDCGGVKCHDYEDCGSIKE